MLSTMIGSGRSYTRSFVQDSNGFFYASTGDSVSENGLAAFMIEGDKLKFLGQIEAVTGVGEDTGRAVDGCLTAKGPSSTTTDFFQAQFHRGSPVLNADESHVFIGNRDDGGGDTSHRLLPSTRWRRGRRA